MCTGASREVAAVAEKPNRCRQTWGSPSHRGRRAPESLSATTGMDCSPTCSRACACDRERPKTIDATTGSLLASVQASDSVTWASSTVRRGGRNAGNGGAGR